MSETKRPWTPGPWGYSHRRCPDEYHRTQVYDSTGATIATLEWHVVNPLAQTITTDRAENAALIAAAPEIFEALVDEAEYGQFYMACQEGRIERCRCETCRRKRYMQIRAKVLGGVAGETK